MTIRRSSTFVAPVPLISVKQGSHVNSATYAFLPLPQGNSSKTTGRTRIQRYAPDGTTMAAVTISGHVPCAVEIVASSQSTKIEHSIGICDWTVHFIKPPTNE